ncbi:AAA family ATPase [Actomonas aquatica]|uniref:AAA family ATPase n=1 Tax=Actomonas aquatica TaxID=2866162 RepID=A0ABZ1C7T0_9BACT|nr:ATP-binding protein [Opitutus sp. WL0086]WRQ87762.1 AAA family ATPase [Opitutus sp. WL0086]
MITSVTFRRFKALRHTQLELAPFNLIVGPNGSGKTSLIQAVLQLRNLAPLPLATEPPPADAPEGPEIRFQLTHPGPLAVSMHCREHRRCDALRLIDGDAASWPAARDRLGAVQVYLLDHYAIAAPSLPTDGRTVHGNGGNLATVVGHWREALPATYQAFHDEALGLFPEYDDLRVKEAESCRLTVALRLTDEQDWVEADSLSQGTLYALALCAIAHEPAPAPIICIEELDRGLHPRLLRQVRDVVYRLSYPSDYGLEREPVQVIATTHSPYLLDLFRDHPEEVVIAEKRGREASFTRLADHPDLDQLLEEGSLGDIWFAGLLGGVPEDS